MNILVINSGSSSLKFALLEPESQATLCQGLAENLGTDSARVRVGMRDVGIRNLVVALVVHGRRC